MLVTERKLLFFDIKRVYFCDYPCDMDGCDIIHFSFCKNKVDANGFAHRKNPTSIIDLTQDLDTIWMNMNRNSRQGIKQAEKAQIKIHLNRHYDEFYQLHKEFQRRKGFGSMFGSRTPNVATMVKYGTLFAAFTAECEDEILVGDLYLEDKDHILWWLSASRRLEVDKEKASLIAQANRLIQWEVIKYAKEKSIKEYDLGGIWSEEEAAQDKLKQNLNYFKLSFGGQMVTRYSYDKVYSKRYKFAQHVYHPIRLGRR